MSHRYLMLSAALLGALLAGCAIAPGDAAITAQVQERLAQQPDLQAPNQVYVQTVDHVVYLSGLVDTPFQRAAAEALAQAVPGVTGVRNGIGLAGNQH